MEKKESKLEEIYGLVEYSKKTGIELTEEQLRRVAEQEEQYIREEVLPVLRDNIEPVLRQIKRELTLVVNYKPEEESITVRISREANLSDLESAAELTPDDIPEIHRRSKQQRTGERMPDKRLLVTMDDGTVLDEDNATDTFCEVIERVGLLKVRNLGIVKSGINIVSTSKDPNRQQRQMGEFYVFTNRSTEDKAKILREIARQLGLGIKVEVID